MSDLLSAPVALFHVGIDWAAETHAVCVLDDVGKVKSTFTITHTADGFTDLIRRLGKLGDRADVTVAIERPDGRLVDALLEAGHPVVPVSPNAIKTWRDGQVVSGAKSDAGDALVIAEYLRLRQHKLRIAVPFSDQTKALRTAVRTRTDLVEMRVAATNQLTALLDMHWPGAKAIFADVESPIALKFLTRYPTPASAARLARSASPRSAPPTATPAADPPASCSPGCATPPMAPPAPRSPTRSSTRLGDVTVLTALNTAIKTSTRPCHPPRGATGRARSSRRCQGRSYAMPRCSRRGGRSPMIVRTMSTVCRVSVTSCTRKIRAP